MFGRFLIHFWSIVEHEIEKCKRESGDFPARRAEFKDFEDLGEELADVIFVVLWLANQTGIDINEAFEKKLKQKSKRDKNRHQNNKKLKS